MYSPGSYAIIDVSEHSKSQGKILVLLDDPATAHEMAIELRRRHCDVTVQEVQQRHGLVVLSAADDNPVELDDVAIAT